MSKALSPAALTLTQARRVVWPFNRNRGLAGRTIGELLDAGQLIRRDLEWALANARSHGLQNACRVLLSEPERTRALCEMPAAVLENELECEESAVARLLDPPDIRPESPPPMRWQDLIPPDFEPQTQCEMPKPEPIPQACPVCGSAVRPDYRWTTHRRAGWRCDKHGLAHYLEAIYVPMLQAVYAPDAWVIPSSEDGTYPGVRRRDLVKGPIGYWPEAN